EDGIRVFHVTGVQTCALPISMRPERRPPRWMDPPQARPRPVASTTHPCPDHPSGPRPPPSTAPRPLRTPSLPRDDVLDGSAEPEMGRASCRTGSVFNYRMVD